MEEKIKLLLSLGFERIGDAGSKMFHYKKNVFVVKDEDSIEKMEEDARAMIAGVSESMEPKKEEELPFDGEEDDPFVSGSEDVEPAFMAPELSAIQTPVFRRLTIDGNRYYYRYLEDGTTKLYTSGTTLINDGYADNKDTLVQWKELQKLMGKDPFEVTEYEADKGTIMHYLYEKFLSGRAIYLRRSFIVKMLDESDLKISERSREKFKKSKDDIDNMIERVVRFAKWVSDYKVRPLAIEKILSLEEYDVASPIDLICEITTKEKEEGYFGEVYKRKTGDHEAGDPKLSTREVEKKSIVIVDFKSGGMHNSQILQLELYRRMVKEWYDIDVSGIYNFSPKSESSKKYTFRERSGSKEILKADCVFEQGRINHVNKNKKVSLYRGYLSIDEGFNEEDCTKTYDIVEELTKRNKNG